MSVRIQLDKQHTTYTNLDFISGTVILGINNPETISAITVKLEGESRSRLSGQLRREGAFNPRGNYYDPYEKDQTQLEVHKVSKYPLDGRAVQGRFADHSCSCSIKSPPSSLRKRFLGYQVEAGATRYHLVNIRINSNSR